MDLKSVLAISTFFREKLRLEYSPLVLSPKEKLSAFYLAINHFLALFITFASLLSLALPP